MDTKLTIENDKGRVLATTDDQQAGYLDFTLVDGVMVIERTVSKVSGKYVGKNLVLEAINYARKHKLKVNPVCAYAYSVMVRDENFKRLMTDTAGEGVSCQIW